MHLTLGRLVAPGSKEAWLGGNGTGRRVGGGDILLEMGEEEWAEEL